MKKINFLLTALLFLALFGCDKKDEKIKSNWTLIAQSGDSRWYTDFESMNQKSVGIFSFKELYDTDKEFEAIKDDGRKVKSIITERLVNCTDGRTKNGIFTAYTENMGKGLSFEGVSKLDNWMGTVPNTPSREIVMAICHPELKTNLESKQENLSIATNKEYEAYIGKSYEEVKKLLEQKEFEEMNFGFSVFEKNKVLMIVEYAPTGQGNIASIQTSPLTKLPEEIENATSIDGFDSIVAKKGWIEKNDAKVFTKTTIKDKVASFQYLAVRYETFEPKKVISITDF